MKKTFQILFVLYFGILTAQENTLRSVYFKFDKSYLEEDQLDTLIGVVNSTNFSKIDSIKIYGYCDDRGTEDYNYILSKKRVTSVQEILLANGVSEAKISIYEGRGRINLDSMALDNIEEIREKNRRVDCVFIKNRPQSLFPTQPKVGDLVILDKILFDMSSSALSVKTKMELDKLVVLLEKHKTLCFEIRGHVCCTPSKYPDAVDKETQERNLSVNRARKVFHYLRSKGISPYRMSFKGYGNRFPLGKNDAQDRRVELVITRL